MKVAVTLLALDIETLHVLLGPEQAPPQPVNEAPDPGVAVRVTVEFAVSFWEQTEPPAPQVSPPPVTVPSPVTETESGKVEPVPAVNAAVTLLALFIVTAHAVEEPAHAPPQPENPEPDPAVAVSVTDAPAVSLALQPVPPAEVQAMPPPVTVPLPVTVTVSVKVVADCVNVAVRLWSASIVTVQLLVVPLHAPPQPLKL